jgi:hypothetical protein
MELEIEKRGIVKVGKMGLSIGAHWSPLEIKI